MCEMLRLRKRRREEGQGERWEGGEVSPDRHGTERKNPQSDESFWNRSQCAVQETGYQVNFKSSPTQWLKKSSETKKYIFFSLYKEEKIANILLILMSNKRSH